jgi:PAS domain S-box-containing protein
MGTRARRAAEVRARGGLAEPPADSFFVEALFDCTPDVAFFVKGLRGEYLVVNQTLVQRCGAKSKAEVVGRTAGELFPAPLGEAYAAQDRQVLGGRPLRDRLELHLYPDGRRGWCLTHKLPLYGASGRVVGLVGISRDLQHPDERGDDYRRIAKAVVYLQEHYDEPLRVAALARLAQLSPTRFRRLVQRIFQLTPARLLVKTRLDAAAALLTESDLSVATIAVECGYSDQSAFTRQFHALVGMTPREFRRAARAPAAADS